MNSNKMNLGRFIYFSSELINDFLFRRKFLKNYLKSYFYEKSFSYPCINLETKTIVDIIPNAEEECVKLSGIFEIPKFPLGIKSERFFTASTNLVDSFCLALFAKKFAKEKILEIGTSFGETALTFALNSPENCVVYTIDIQNTLSNPTIGRKFRNKNIEKKIKFYSMDIERVFSILPPKSVDIIFIDGDHSYEGVKKDTEYSLSLIKDNGIIIWHDCCVMFLDGVVKYLDELKKNKNLKIIKIAHTNLTLGYKIEI
ncbi:MAG: class I SAM-dependent methyltransferase [Chthoniobacterales bacterium]|nr:class I SAM-dependent methyltransferase [Chthoniobacterales bacterium]